jgi:hypothetical protein
MSLREWMTPLAQPISKGRTPKPRCGLSSTFTQAWPPCPSPCTPAKPLQRTPHDEGAIWTAQLRYLEYRQGDKNTMDATGGPGLRKFPFK